MMSKGFGNGVKNLKGAKPFPKSYLKSYDIAEKKMLLISSFFK